MSAAPKLATYEALLALADDVKAEIVAGVLEALPAPRPAHSKIQRALGRFVGGPFDDDDGFGGPGGWYLFVEVDIELAKHEIVRPDLSGWRRERLADPHARPFKIVPDWVCEIESPSTVRRDRVVKRRLYAEHGIRHYWLVDPEARTLTALELRDGIWVEIGVYDDTMTVGIVPFEAVAIPLTRIFLRPLAPTGP